MTAVTPAGAPALSVVVVTPARFAQLRRTVHALRDQDVAERMELLLVAPDEAALSDRVAADTAGIGAVRVVGVGPIANVDKASAAGVHAARAPVVAIVEDHAFPQPEWARALLEAHAAHPEAVAVGSLMLNANPDRGLSWANLLIAYGEYTDPRRHGAIGTLPGHNVCLKRAAILERYGDRLVDALGRDGTLMEDLAASDRPLVLALRARIAHVNPSRLAPTVRLRVAAGRLYGTRRATAGGWGSARRALYVLGGPLIPFVRLRRLGAEHFGGGRRADVRGRALPALFLGLVLDAIGQMLGYAMGPGNALDILATFEMDRRQHLVASERAALTLPPPSPAPGRDGRFAHP